MTPGEVAHDKGRDGVFRAKTWLERTGRTQVSWTVYEHPGMLTVPIPSGLDRSFDLGGLLQGDDLDGHLFYAEVKFVATVGEQSAKYQEYLANCYCTMLHDPDKDFQFMWITWHPFDQSKWLKLVTVEEVTAAITARKEEWLGAGSTIDASVCKNVADRLWMIVISERQEQLVMSDEMLGEVRRQVMLRTK